MAENKKIDLNKFYKDLGISDQASNNTASKEEQMKTKEFIRGVEELGYFINDYGDYCEITDVDENPIAEINKTVLLQISTDHYGWDKLSDIDKKELFDLLIEYAKTPIEDREDREEEKKFYLKHRYLQSSWTQSSNVLNYSVSDNTLALSDDRQVLKYKTKFTLKEIEEIKEKLNTDLADFELVEVEE